MSALEKASREIETSVLEFYEATFSSEDALCPDEYVGIDYVAFHDAVAVEFRKVNKKVSTFGATITQLINHSIDERLSARRYTEHTNFKHDSLSNALETPSSQSERDEMTGPTREEIEARLRATEATVDARLAGFEKNMAETLSSMRVDIATMQSAITTQLSAAQNDIKREISQTSINAGELKGEIGGIKTVTNWTLAILGLAAAVAAVVVAIIQLRAAPVVAPASPSPIVIQLPPTPAPPMAPRANQPSTSTPPPSSEQGAPAPDASKATATPSK